MLMKTAMRLIRWPEGLSEGRARYMYVKGRPMKEEIDSKPGTLAVDLKVGNGRPGRTIGPTHRAVRMFAC